MLPKKYRLPLRNEFKRIQKRGRLWQGELFSLLVYRDPVSFQSRFGFVVSSVIDKKAVGRNRIRRWLAASLKPLLPLIKPGYAVVFLVKKNIVGKNFEQIQEAIKSLFQQADLINDLAPKTEK